jgi:hypothetical protein
LRPGDVEDLKKPHQGAATEQTLPSAGRVLPAGVEPVPVAEVECLFHAAKVVWVAEEA